MNDWKDHDPIRNHLRERQDRPPRRPRITTTHTYVLLEIPREAYDFIREKLERAGYQHAIGDAGELDMHGIALLPIRIDL